MSSIPLLSRLMFPSVLVGAIATPVFLLLRKGRCQLSSSLLPPASSVARSVKRREQISAPAPDTNLVRHIRPVACSLSAARAPRRLQRGGGCCCCCRVPLRSRLLARCRPGMRIRVRSGPEGRRWALEEVVNVLVAVLRQSDVALSGHGCTRPPGWSVSASTTSSKSRRRPGRLPWTHRPTLPISAVTA